MAERPHIPTLFSMPANRAFSDALASGLLRRFGGKDRVTGLARGIVLLPNNRAVQALQEAFVRQSGGGLLLPRMVPIGDLDLGERIGGALDPIGSDTPLAPVVDPLQRQLILSRLVAAAYHADARAIDGAEAMRLADALGRTLDQLQVEDIAPSALADEGLVGELSSHWEASLKLFRIVTEQWPVELARIGAMDVADRRNRLLRGMAERWERQGSAADFIIAAGIGSGSPAVAALLASVAKLSQGMVVFSDLDLAMPEEEWAALGHDPKATRDHDAGDKGPIRIESHPQYHLKLLLDRMGFARAEAEEWPHRSERDSPAKRGRLVGNAFAPAAFTGKWQELPAAERSLGGITAYALATPADEAQLIALALREALESEGRTAALVTPDRNLATRVAAHLQRWGISADDSAGRPLSTTVAGTLPVQMAEAAARGFAPVELLTLLKHPLIAAGEQRTAWLRQVRELDLILRGPRPGAGLDAIRLHIEQLRDDSDNTWRKDELTVLLNWWAGVDAMLQPLAAIFAAEETPIAPAIAALQQTMTAFAGDAAWRGQEGRAVADLFERLGRFAPDGPALVRTDALGTMLDAMLRTVAIRPAQGGHPRIFIWGLIEAQLQRADLMILGGLNEGSWPGLPSPDPWLAPGIRRRLGLPGLETRIGLAAHDFAGALAAKDVILTRAERDGGAPTIASRFWLRLAALSGKDMGAKAGGLASLARALDHAATRTEVGQPSPVPSPEQRPQEISVTAVDRLKADPFAFYARAVLNLSALDTIDAEPTAAWRGTAVHAILQDWSEQDKHDPDKLRARAEALMRSPASHAIIRAMWQPRLLAAIDWLADHMRGLIATGRTPFLFEKKGEAELGGVMLHGVADRVDRNSDDSLAIVDYKTGKPPSAAMVAEGFAMQLGLLGAIAEAGGFTDADERVTDFEYWSLSKAPNGDFGYVGSPFSKKYMDQSNPDNFVARARVDFIKAAERWLTGTEGFTAKLNPDYAGYTDYDQLMRLEEWYGREQRGRGDS